VHNLTAALSINHNWFQARHLHAAWDALERDWAQVRARISDCRGTGEEAAWQAEVQRVLLASSCINVDGLLAACHLHALRCMAASTPVAGGDEGACAEGARDVRGAHRSAIPRARAREDGLHVAAVLDRALAHVYVASKGGARDVPACCASAAAECGLPPEHVAAAYGAWDGATLREMAARLRLE
jgi:hypothetical protein